MSKLLEIEIATLQKRIERIKSESESITHDIIMHIDDMYTQYQKNNHVNIRTVTDYLIVSTSSEIQSLEKAMSSLVWLEVQLFTLQAIQEELGGA